MITNNNNCHYLLLSHFPKALSTMADFELTIKQLQSWTWAALPHNFLNGRSLFVYLTSIYINGNGPLNRKQSVKPIESKVLSKLLFCGGLLGGFQLGILCDFCLTLHYIFNLKGKMREQCINTHHETLLWEHILVSEKLTFSHLISLECDFRLMHSRAFSSSFTAFRSGPQKSHQSSVKTSD